MTESAVSTSLRYTRTVYRVYLFNDGITEPLAGDFEECREAEMELDRMGAHFPDAPYVVRRALAYVN